MYLPPSILTLRDFVACFAGPFLRRSRRPSHFMRFIILALIILTDYRLGFNRRPEIGDITTYGSYYEDSPRSSLRPLRGSAIHSSAASPVHSYGGHGDLLSPIDS